MGQISPRRSFVYTAYRHTHTRPPAPLTTARHTGHTVLSVCRMRTDYCIDTPLPGVRRSPSYSSPGESRVRRVHRVSPSQPGPRSQVSPHCQRARSVMLPDNDMAYALRAPSAALLSSTAPSRPVCPQPSHLTPSHRASAPSRRCAPEGQAMVRSSEKYRWRTGV